MKVNSSAVSYSGLNWSLAHQGRSFAKRSIIVFLILLITIVALAPPAQAAGSAQATTFHLHVPAAAELLVSTCPWGDWVPEIDTVCEDSYILYFREGQAFELREQPWRLYVNRTTFIAHPDGTGTLLNEVWGLIENPQGSFDSKKYTYAQVSGTVPMSDGSEFVVDLRWNMALAELHHGGNNSLFNVVNGIDRHYNDRCLTLIQSAHQQWRVGAPGQISGSIGGVDVQSLNLAPFEPFIAGRSVYTYVTAEHGGCTP
jgi:hypothetical protein